MVYPKKVVTLVGMHPRKDLIALITFWPPEAPIFWCSNTYVYKSHEEDIAMQICEGFNYMPRSYLGNFTSKQEWRAHYWSCKVVLLIAILTWQFILNSLLNGIKKWLIEPVCKTICILIYLAKSQNTCQWSIVLYHSSLSGYSDVTTAHQSEASPSSCQNNMTSDHSHSGTIQHNGI